MTFWKQYSLPDKDSSRCKLAVRPLFITQKPCDPPQSTCLSQKGPGVDPHQSHERTQDQRCSNTRLLCKVALLSSASGTISFHLASWKLLRSTQNLFYAANWRTGPFRSPSEPPCGLFIHQLKWRSRSFTHHVKRKSCYLEANSKENWWQTGTTGQMVNWHDIYQTDE